MTKYESEVKQVALPQEEAFARFGDLRNLGALKEKLNDPAIQEVMASQLPADKLEMAKTQLNNVTFEADSVSLQTPIGNVTLRIVEREAPKLLKFASEGSPIPLNLWIQLLPDGETASRLRVTVGAEVNFFMKGMVAKPLQQAADGLASILCLVR